MEDTQVGLFMLLALNAHENKYVNVLKSKLPTALSCHPKLVTVNCHRYIVIEVAVDDAKNGELEGVRLLCSSGGGVLIW